MEVVQRSRREKEGTDTDETFQAWGAPRPSRSLTDLLPVLCSLNMTYGQEPNIIRCVIMQSLSLEAFIEIECGYYHHIDLQLLHRYYQYLPFR